MTPFISRIRYGGILLAAALASYLTLVRPAYQQRSRIIAEVGALSRRVAQGTEDHAARDRARRRLAAIETRLREETRAIPDSSDVAGVISGISSDIRDLNLGSAKLNRGKETAQGSTATSGLLIETTGRFDVVIELLRRIESLPRLVRISSLTAKSVSPETGEVQATIGLDACYRIASAGEAATAGK